MALPTGVTQERRRYFRLDDHVRLRYQPVTEEQAQLPSSTLFPCNDLRSVLAGHDAQIEHLLSELRVKEPLVAELVVQLNLKYQYLADQFIEDKVAEKGETHPLKQVNISACGLAILEESQIAINTLLHFDMILLPNNQRVTCYGCVIACEPEDAQRFRWRIDFRNMSDREQEMLIQHLVKRQTQLRRESR